MAVELGISLQTYGGAIADVDDGDSAFSHRHTQFEYVAATRWADPEEDEARMQTARRSAAKLEPFAAGAYVNVLNDEGRDGLNRAYTPDKMRRLIALKRIHDPENTFHLNHNITPTTEG